MKRMASLLAGITAVSALALQPTILNARGDDHASEHEGAAADAEGEAAALAEAVRLVELWLEDYRQYERVPAISAAIVKDDATVWAKGFGFTDRAMTKPATADTIYSICSISKLFTAVAFMQQWEQGTVRLDEPVATYLPWAKLAPDDRESVPITMRGLLTHSAGLPREAVNPYWTGPDFPFPTQAEIRAGMSGQDPLYPASTTFQYSNLGLTLVGETVEAMSGTPYAEYINANILRPLDMKDTQPFIQADRYGEQMAVGWGSLSRDGTRPAVNLFDARGINPAAGFSSTVNDLAKFAAWQFRLLESGDAEILRASTLREMYRVHYLTPDRKESWGLGFNNFQLGDRDIVGHGGSCPGYRSSLLLDPKNKLGIAMAMNTMENPGGLAMELGKLLAARMDAKLYDDPESGAVDLEDYAGIYPRQPWWRDTAIVPWAGGLLVTATSFAEPLDGSIRLKPLGNDRFQVMRDGTQERDVVTFHRDAQGAVTHFERFGQYVHRESPLP